MTWLAWRQFRTQAIVAGTALVAVAAALLATSPSLAAMFDSSGLAACRAGCGTDVSTFLRQLDGSRIHLIFYGGILLLYAVPALTGLFWGAPLVAREFEAGTFRLAWNQSVTRARWAAAKLGFVGLAAVATTAVLSLMIRWWASPLYLAEHRAGQSSAAIFDRVAPPIFGASGVVPAGCAAFAFALGIAAGASIRRTLPAMAATLVIFAGLQIAIPVLVQPHLLPPVRATASFSASTASEISVSTRGNVTTVTVVGGFSRPGAWMLSNTTITPSGRVFTGPAGPACSGPSATQDKCNNWLDSLHLRQLVSYQPASRYWPLQWLELTLYLLLAAGLGWLAVRQVRRSHA